MPRGEESEEQSADELSVWGSLFTCTRLRSRSTSSYTADHGCNLGPSSHQNIDSNKIWKGRFLQVLPCFSHFLLLFSRFLTPAGNFQKSLEPKKCQDSEKRKEAISRVPERIFIFSTKVKPDESTAP